VGRYLPVAAILCEWVLSIKDLIEKVRELNEMVVKKCHEKNIEKRMKSAISHNHFKRDTDIFR